MAGKYQVDFKASWHLHRSKFTLGISDYLMVSEMEMKLPERWALIGIQRQMCTQNGQLYSPRNPKALQYKAI